MGFLGSALGSKARGTAAKAPTEIGQNSSDGLLQNKKIESNLENFTCRRRKKYFVKFAQVAAISPRIHLFRRAQGYQCVALGRISLVQQPRGGQVNILIMRAPPT